MTALDLNRGCLKIIKQQRPLHQCAPIYFWITIPNIHTMLFTLKKKISVTNTYFCPDGKIKVFFCHWHFRTWIHEVYLFSDQVGYFPTEKEEYEFVLIYIPMKDLFSAREKVPLFAYYSHKCIMQKVAYRGGLGTANSGFIPPPSSF